MNFRTPIGRVTGHGSAKSGAHHWWVERVTGAALLPLGVWFVASLLWLHVTHRLADHARMIEWLAAPWTALPMLLFIVTCAMHSRLGMQVFIEDYVHGKANRLMCLLASSTIHIVAAAAAVLAVLRIALGR